MTGIEGETQTTKKRTLFTGVAELLMPRFPDLRDKLKIAEMKEIPVEFLEKVSAKAAIASECVLVLAYILLKDPILNAFSKNLPVAIILLIMPLILIPPISLMYFMMYPSAVAAKRKREIDYEVVFAGRHIAIAVKSGMPLFEAFVGASSGYGMVSKEIRKIVDKVTLGVPMIQAIKDVTQYNPSSYFNRVMLQIANSLASGADVGSSLESALEQMSKEQMISLKEYSQKLTPLVMFYMIFGVVVPSLGVVLMTVILSAVSGGGVGQSSQMLLAAIFAVIFFIQFLFLGLIESSRPKYLMG